MELLLFSNGLRKPEKLLKFALSDICNFIGNDIDEILFIPFARVLMDEDEYTKQIQDAFLSTKYKIKSISEGNGILDNIKHAKCILVGGGNTFNLLHTLYQYEVLNLLREKIISGTKYISWSAGSNIVSPTIKTTNDMPIIEPVSLNSLNLIPYQINPHFIDSNNGNIGESRENRIKEFMAINPDSKVLGLRNGSYLKIIDNKMTYLGTSQVRLYTSGGFSEVNPDTVVEIKC